MGDVIQLNGQSWQVIGILQPQLTAPFLQTQVFAPRVFEVTFLTSAQIDVGAGFAQPIARLAPGVTMEQARVELAALSRAYGQEFGSKLDAPNLTEPHGFVDTIVGPLKPTYGMWQEAQAVSLRGDMFRS